MAHQPRYQEKCGVFVAMGIRDAAQYVAEGLDKINHRGQDSAGIVSSDGHFLYHHRMLGLAKDVFADRNKTPVILPGDAALGHVRYTTSLIPTAYHAQPIISDTGPAFALAHNGNIPWLSELCCHLENQGAQINHRTDSELAHAAISLELQKGKKPKEAFSSVYNLFDGSFTFGMMGVDWVAMAKDRFGIRPGAIGRTKQGGFVGSSESCALGPDIESWQELQPGQMVIARSNGEVTTHTLAEPHPMPDAFEFFYLASPQSQLDGRLLGETRYQLGCRLAKEHPFGGSSTVVVGVPNSGLLVAQGYADALGAELTPAITRSTNPDIKRTFITPRSKRMEMAMRKYDIEGDLVRGKEVVVIDDSIVEGTTNIATSRKLFDAGARAVHQLAASPEIVDNHGYGVQIDAEYCLARGRNPQQMAKIVGATSVGHLSLDGALQVLGRTRQNTGLFPFIGEYPHVKDYPSNN